MDQTIQDFVANPVAQISILGFLLNLVLAAVLSFLLHVMYIKFGKALSNRKMFSQNFMLITLTTTLIITVVKSSLALSLGLVGALSIVRFRTAIKEPEELAYLFLAIAIGLGMGADQRVITILAALVIFGAIWLRNATVQMEYNQNLHLTISSHNPEKVELEEVVEVLKTYCSAIELRRFDESAEVLEATFLIEADNFAQLVAAKSGLHKLGDSVNISFLDNKGIASVA